MKARAGHASWFLRDLAEVRAEGRDDVDFHDPAARSGALGLPDVAPRPLGTLCRALFAGRAPTSAAAETGRGGPSGPAVAVVRVRHVTGRGLLADAGMLAPAPSRTPDAHRWLRRGDVLVVAAAHHRDYIGRCDLVLDVEEGRCLASAELLVVRPDPAVLDPSWLLALLRHPATRADVRRRASGQSAHLYPAALAALAVRLPELAAQRALGARLVEAQGLLRDRQALAEREWAAALALVERELDGAPSSAPPGRR